MHSIRTKIIFLTVCVIIVSMTAATLLGVLAIKSVGNNGANDILIPRETVMAFAEQHHAGLTVMENGEHWFHTPEQLQFLDDWILQKTKETD